MAVISAANLSAYSPRRQPFLTTTVGTMGPPKTPLLTAVGDNINIAARLEAQTKVQGHEIIVSIETLQKESIEFPKAEMKSLEVRGLDNQVRVCLLDRNQLDI